MTRRRHTRTKTSQNRPKSAKRARTIIPPPQRERIMQLYASGKSMRQIARKEKRDRATVAKIVNSDDMRDHVAHLREQFYGLGGDALKTVRNGIVAKKNAQLSYRMLMDMGVVPSPLERQPIQANIAVIKEEEELNEFEKEMVGESQGLHRQIGLGMARMVQRRAKIYGLELPTVQELRHNDIVNRVMEHILETQGKKLSSLNDSERHHFTLIVENALRDIKEAKEKYRQDQVNARAAKATLPLKGYPGSTQRPPLHLHPDDSGNGPTGQSGSGSPSDDNPPK